LCRVWVTRGTGRMVRDNPQVPLLPCDELEMIAVIFEVRPVPGRKQDYLDIAAELRAELVKIDGFISVERFQSLSDPEKLLSLSFWCNEDAVRNWRNNTKHRKSQILGRNDVFAGYRLIVADVIRDYSMTERSEAPADSRAVHER
jgi:heme-degrading monooxygenase HmoA